MKYYKLTNIYLQDILLEADQPQTKAPAGEEVYDAASYDDLEIRIGMGKKRLRVVAPFLNRLLGRLNIIVVPPDSNLCPTMAVDPKGNIYINPKFSKKLTDVEFYTILAHEAMHIANGTFFRQKVRDMHDWNIATDLIINWSLLKDGFQIPPGFYGTGDKNDPTGAEFVNTGETTTPWGTIKVIDENNQLMTCEDVYDQIKQLKDDLIKNGRKTRIIKKIPGNNTRETIIYDSTKGGDQSPPYEDDIPKNIVRPLGEFSA
jgi:hypothetical protein